MPEELIDEPIAVTATFSGGVITPSEIEWKQRCYPVTTIHARWTTREGAHPVRNLSVEIEAGDVYHITLNTRTLTWRLERILLP
jgi:hypothetical protein